METYKIVAELSNKNGYRTLLLKHEDGGLAVCKEVTSEIVVVYQRLYGNPHPNIITIYQIWRVNETRYAVIMEYFPADTLEELLEREGTLRVPEAKQILRQCCLAVDHFHKAGIIHRDLNPSNLLINAEGLVKVTDFGISRFCKQGKKCDTKILGTAGYAAPEQFGFMQTDQKTDIYALGVIMNQMLTGKIPSEEKYVGDYRIQNLIKRCISMSPEERCDLAEIERVLGGHSIKRPFRKAVLKCIPGFRSGNKVHKVLAVIEYIYVLLIAMLMCFISFIDGYRIRWLLMLAGVFVSTIGVGYFAGTFSEISYSYHMDKGVRKFLLILLYSYIAFIQLMIGMAFIIISFSFI